MSSSPKRAWRIIRTVGRYRLDAVIAEWLPRRYRWLKWLSPFQLAGRPEGSRGDRITEALESLGPVFVKFGQMLSTRRDLLPLDIADAMTRLQDQVPPFDPTAARRLIEEALGEAVDQVFSTFDRNALASASVAQVHAATLKDGSDVVVKVIRPDIEPVIREDIELLRTIANGLDRALDVVQRLHLPEIVDDYEATILDELDLRKEAANTRQLRMNFAASETLYVPRVYRHLCRRNVLVMERVNGIPIGQVSKLIDAGTDMKVLAQRGVETFFKQVFVDNFFHADMHPGNIFVDVSEPSSPKYIAIDCAIIGQLTAADQDYLARNLFAFFNSDYREVARLHLESGWIPADTDIDAFEAVIREVCEPIFAVPLSEISFGHFVVQLFQTAQDFGMEIQPQLVLLQKTLLNIEGLGRQLYPELDLWETAAPIMERWMADRVGPQATVKALSDNAPALLEALPRLPELIVSASRDAGRLDRLTTEHRSVRAQLKAKQEAEQRRRRRSKLAGIALLVVAMPTLWAPVTASLASGVSGLSIAGALAAVVGLTLLLRS